MAKIDTIHYIVQKPARREYSKEDYERMIAWVQKNVDFKDVLNLIKKLNEKLGEVVLAVAKGDMSVEEALNTILSEREQVVEKIDDVAWDEIIERVYEVAKIKLGKDTAEKIKKGWENARTYDTYNVFGEFFEELKEKIPSKMAILVRILASRKPDVVYTVKGKVVKRYKWLDIEIQLLKELVQKGYSIKDIQAVMPYRTINSIRNKIYRLRQKGEL